MKPLILSIGIWFLFLSPAVSAYNVAEGDYKLPAVIDPEILADSKIELWARVYWPGTRRAVEPGSHPLAVFLHGNHATCGYGEKPRLDTSIEYTHSGRCPYGSVPTPNHRGYDHIARALSSKGFIVVSINSNRGINGGNGNENDWGLNKARGRLVLRHLEKLSFWNTDGGSTRLLGVDLKDRIDFSRVGLMGHSRGGEGVLAAHNFYNDTDSPWPARIPNLRVKAIFEIAPVDGQTARTFDAVDVPWVVLLPRCDGDVYDLQGIHVFDRAFKRTYEKIKSPKSTLYIFGANHNFFNSEWQESDSSACGSGEHQLWEPQDWQSERQLKIGLDAVKAFMMHHVVGSDDPSYEAIFNPVFPMPDDLALITKFNREFIDTSDESTTIRLVDTESSQILEDITATAAKIDIGDSDSPTNRKVLRIQALAGKSKVNFKVKSGTPVSFADVSTLDFSIRSPIDIPPLNVRISMADGTLSKVVDFISYATFTAEKYSALASVRIPISAFGEVNQPVVGIELLHDGASSHFELATIIATKGGSVSLITSQSVPTYFGQGITQKFSAPRVQGSIISRIGRSQGDPSGSLQVTVESPSGFPIRGEVPRLVIGTQEFLVSRYASPDLRRLIFTLSSEQIPPHGLTAEVRYGKEKPSLVVELGDW